MAAFLVRACLKQRNRLSDILGIDRYSLVRINACHKLCVECQSYHTTPAYFKKRRTQEEKKNVQSVRFKTKDKSAVIDVWRNMTVAELAEVSNRSVKQVLDALSYMDSSNHNKNSIFEDRHVLFEVAKKLGYKCRTISKAIGQTDEEKDSDIERRPPPDPSDLVKRHPVVTVMGHVDHGKTTLLDSLRNTSVVETEFGGITQHIGAFNVTLPTGDKVTFLDTPGHAAFKTMRERGAKVTDIVILVVAADDGVMEQTVESIRMAQEANVPIIVAINKIDKPSADIQRTQSMLSQRGILVEELGGDIQSVNISALQGTNLTMLIDTVVTQAEVMALAGDPKGFVEGVVIEASLDQGRGKLATVLVQRGTLRKGAILVCGLAWAKVRAMFDHAGRPVTEGRLSDPVQVIGWRELPVAGDGVLEVEDENKAHAVLRVRETKVSESKMLAQQAVVQEKQKQHEAEYNILKQKKRRIGRFWKLSSEPRKPESEVSNKPRLNVILKGDVVGSVEAILDVFDTYTDEDRCHFDVVHYGVGPVTETDIELAKAFDAIIYCFNVPAMAKVSQQIKEKGIDMRHHRVIYKLIDDIKQEINKKLPPETAEEIIGKANVLQLFVITEKRKEWNVAGCRCTDGNLKKSQMFRLKRDDEIIYEGKLASMRHLKTEVDSIKSGVECGLRFEDPKVALQSGDELICYRIYNKQPETSWDPGF